MHKINVRILGPSSFISTLNELKAILKFNPLVDNSNDNANVILFHIDVLEDKKQKKFIDSYNAIKICVGKKKTSHFPFLSLWRARGRQKEASTALRRSCCAK